MIEWYQRMTWGEFKAFVDAALGADGLGDEINIFFIDVQRPIHPHTENPFDMGVPSVGVHEDEMIVHLS